MTFPFPFISPVGGIDPYRAFVVFQSLFTGSDGSTSFTDDSTNAATVTVVGNAQILSNKLELDGTTDWIRVPDLASLQLTGDFCLEFFGVETDTLTTLQVLASHYDAFNPATNNRGWFLGFRGSVSPKKLELAVSTDGTSGTVTLNQVTWSPSAATAYDICIERNGTTVRFFVDGVWIGSTTYSGNSFDCSSPLAIGTDNPRATTQSNCSEWDGRLSAVRLTVGAYRYGSDASYTVPALPLPTS